MHVFILCDIHLVHMLIMYLMYDIHLHDVCLFLSNTSYSRHAELEEAGCDDAVGTGDGIVESLSERLRSLDFPWDSHRYKQVVSTLPKGEFCCRSTCCLL